MQGPTIACSNCFKELPTEKIDLHEAYCRRNVKPCSRCGEFIDKRELENHEKDQHSKKKCSFCSLTFESAKLEVHSKTCTKKPRLCTFCNLEINGDSFASHNYQCGSRTKECSYCSKNIILRDFDLHENQCMLEEIKRAEQKEKEKIIVPPVNESKPFKSEGGGYSNYIKKNSLKKEPPSNYNDFPNLDGYKPISGATKADPIQNKYNEIPIAQKKFDSGYEYPKLDPNSFDFNKNKSPNINYMENKYMENKFDNKQPMNNKNAAAPFNPYGVKPPSYEGKSLNNPPATSYTKNFSQNTNDLNRGQYKKQNLEQPIKQNDIQDFKPKRPENSSNINQFNNNYGVRNKEIPNPEQQFTKTNINNIRNTKTNKQEEPANFNQVNNYGAINKGFKESERNDNYEKKKQTYDQAMNAIKDKSKPMGGYNAYAYREAEKIKNGKINVGGLKRDYATKENNVNVPSRPYEKSLKQLEQDERLALDIQNQFYDENEKLEESYLNDPEIQKVIKNSMKEK